LIIYLISLFYIAQPVSVLAAEVDSLAPGERPSKPSLYNRNDELGSLARNTYEYMVKSHEFAARLQNEQMERLELEEKLRHSQKMDAIGQLAGGIAHDFNNIMTVIMGNANLAQTFLAQGKTERIEKSLNAIVESSERAAKLTNQLLVFSRKDLSEPVSVVCDELIKNSAKMLERLISEEMHISYDLKPVKPILADESQIDLILINLTVNARDAMPTGGDIKITCENTTLSGKQLNMISTCPEGEYVHISISDNGVGIDADLLERVFDPFFTTKPVGKGTGLGLSTVYGIITKWDGCINIESKVGKGTTVHIYFPVSNVSNTPKIVEEVPEQADYNFSGKVLVCEDDDNVRSYIVDLLSTTDFEIISVANPLDAVDIYRNHEDIILLITDIIMPGMNGRELADELNSIRKVPAIFVSGYSENVFDDKGIITDDITFIQKPFTQEKLFSAVKETLQHH
jgi:signal transduction histidine kinase